MRIHVQNLASPNSTTLDAWIEGQIQDLGSLRHIDEARVHLARNPGGSPAYEVDIHLVTPGPDVHATARGHTLRATIGEAVTELRQCIVGRAIERKRRLKTKTSARRGV